MARPRCTSGALLALACLAAAPSLWAEAPPRDRYRDHVIVTRRAFAGEATTGIWLFDPDRGAFSYLRPFEATLQSGLQVPRLFDGGDGYLDADGDVVTYQTWPGLLDYDAFSWRLIRRRPSPADPGQLGWVVQGPSLDEAWAEGLGLQAGSYGFARCVLPVIAPASARECPPWPYPGEVEHPRVGSDVVVLRRGRPDQSWEVAGTLTPSDWSVAASEYDFPPALTFDGETNAFYRLTPRGVDHLSILGGQLADDAVHVDFGLELFDDEYVESDRLLRLPGRSRFLGSARSVGPYYIGERRYLFEADEASGAGRVLAESPSGLPTAMAVLEPAPDRFEQLVPVVARGQGARGTYWTTELWLFNPSSDAMDVRLRRVSSASWERQLQLPPHRSLSIPDVIGWLGLPASGSRGAPDALEVSSSYRWGEQLVAAGRISTMDPETGGRFGHAVPAVPTPFGYSNHIPFLWGEEELNRVESPGLDPAFLDLDLFDPGRFRFNIGVVNQLDSDVALRLVWGYNFFWALDYSEHWPAATTREISVGPRSVELFSLEDLFPESVRHAFPPRIAVVGELPAAVWLSIVDNRTGDATFIPFTTYRYFNYLPDARLVIPAVARTRGLNGAEWRTDLVGPTIQSFPYGMPLVAFRPSRPDSACGGAAGGSDLEARLIGDIGMPPSVWLDTLEEISGRPVAIDTATLGYRIVYRDVISMMPGCEDEASSVGALEVATASWTSGWSRTYTTRPDGGTYGGMLPFYPPGGWPVQHFAGLEVGPEQRINVGLYNGIAEHPVTHRLLLYAADGTLAAAREIVLEPHEHRQEPLARLLAVPVDSLPDGLYGLTVIPLDDPEQGLEGRSWAYVSLVDNRTNDPVNLW